MFRAMYDNATAVVRVRKNDGTDEFSAPFPINRGVVQGGIDSPWYFILALEVIFRECDNQGGINLDLPSGNILRLEYADDAALLCTSTQEATLRLTAIAVCSRKIGDLEGSRPKTESMEVRKQPRLALPTEPQIRKTLGAKCHVCIDCNRGYSTAHGLKTHQTHGRDGCRWRDCCKTTEVDRIVDIRGGGDYLRFFATPITTRRTRSGHSYGTAQVEWTPEPIVRQRPGGNEAITAFYASDKMADAVQMNDDLLLTASDPAVQHECQGEKRCPHCSAVFTSEALLKAHCRSRVCPRILTRDRTSATVKDVHYKMRKETDQGDPVLMEGEAISRVHEFKYLGYLFVADNDQLVNIDRRIGQANTVFRSLQHIWRIHSDKLPISLKRRIYCASVVSVLTYGHETWNLDETVQRRINNFNARCLAQIYIGHRDVEPADRAKLISEFCVNAGTVSKSGIVGRCNYDLIAHLRARRLRWLGHILRLPQTELLRQIVEKISWPKRHKQPGGIFMDAPPTSRATSQDDTLAFGELHYLAGNHTTEWGRENCFKWCQRVASLIPADQRTKPVPQYRGDRFARVQRTALSREEKDAAIKEKADAQLGALPAGSRLAYTDGGADGNGANGQHGACGFGVVVTEKQVDWTPESQPTVLDCYFGPVVCDQADPFWLGAARGTNNTGELNGISTAVLHLQREGGHQPAAICYDSKYAANVTDGTWDAKKNVEAARINRDLYEAEHERRSGGVIMVHVKGHSGDIGNDYADAFVQDGKGLGPFSRIQLSRGETQTEKCARHRTLSAMALPFELVTDA